MASRVNSKIETFSRFSVLAIDSDEECEKKEEANKKSSKSIKNAKKKAIKKKNKSIDAEVIIYKRELLSLYHFIDKKILFIDNY